MGWIQRTWDGPFKTPLQQPITVGWALLKLFETLWRLLLIIVLLIALLAIYVWQAERNPLSSQIGVGLSSAPPDCAAKGRRILAHLQNRSRKVIGEVDLQFRVYAQGSSTDVASIGAYQQLHNILKPGESLDWCFPEPQLEAASISPYTIAATVTNASELAKDVPVTSRPQPESAAPPAIVQPPAIEVTTSPLHRAAPAPALWTKALNALGAMVCLGLFASGAFGVIILFNRLFGARILEDVKSGFRVSLILVFTAVINAGAVDASSYALTAYGWGGWLTRLDSWSWAHGLADGGLMFIAALACQWPWVVLFALRGWRQAERSSVAEAQGQADSL